MPGLRPTLHEFKEGTLHSGSKHGPVVTDRKQAIAIALHEGREAGERVSPLSRAKAHLKARYGR
jgi:uncharacterized protein DUF6496